MAVDLSSGSGLSFSKAEPTQNPAQAGPNVQLRGKRGGRSVAPILSLYLYLLWSRYPQMQPFLAANMLFKVKRFYHLQRNWKRLGVQILSITHSEHLQMPCLCSAHGDLDLPCIAVVGSQSAGMHLWHLDSTKISCILQSPTGFHGVLIISQKSS